MDSIESTDARVARSRWRAVLRRDTSADGEFVFAVRTTRVFCRPSCPARRPRREHAEFFADAAAAARAGYRPCRRCRPEVDVVAERREWVVRLCRRLERSDAPVPLRDLARDVGISPERLRRWFVAAIGVTPRDFQRARRAERVAAMLRAGRSVTVAQHAAGFGSTRGLQLAAEQHLGMSPRRLRDGAPAERIAFAVRSCTLGLALLAATERGICAILLGDEAAALRRNLRQRFPAAALAPADERFAAWFAAALAAVDGAPADAAVPLDLRGTAFRQRVWRELQRVARGSTVDYGELARRIGRPGAARAVAGACAANPLAVVIPCHRVVRADGELSGYRWGVERKRRLLARERDGDGTA